MIMLPIILHCTIREVNIRIFNRLKPVHIQKTIWQSNNRRMALVLVILRLDTGLISNKRLGHRWQLLAGKEDVDSNAWNVRRWWAGGRILGTNVLEG